MRTTITIDDELIEDALELAAPGTSATELLREAVKVYIQVRAGERLAALGGSMPTMPDIPRRKSGSL